MTKTNILLPRLFILLLIVVPFLSQGQTGQWVEGTMAGCQDPDFNRKVNKMLNYSVDVIGVQDLETELSKYTVLDIREKEEYGTSHIPGAIYFGYDDPEYHLLDNIDKDTPIVVYCSIGYRSEKMGEKLQKRGYTNVVNLYGSIFEWANCGYPLEGPKDLSTNKVHTYNKKWSKWLINEGYEKVW